MFRSKVDPTSFRTFFLLSAQHETSSLKETVEKLCWGPVFTAQCCGVRGVWTKMLIVDLFILKIAATVGSNCTAATNTYQSSALASNYKYCYQNIIIKLNIRWNKQVSQHLTLSWWATILSCLDGVWHQCHTLL